MRSRLFYSKQNGFAEIRNRRADPEADKNFLRKGFALTAFAVNDNDAGTLCFFFGDRREPAEQIRLSGVRGKAAERVNLSANADFFSVNAHALASFREQASERAFRLEAADEQGRFRFPKVVFEVVQNAPAVAHACARHDDARTLDVVERAGFFSGFADFETGKCGGERACFCVFGGFFVVKFRVFEVKRGGFNRHRAVEINRNFGQFVFFEKFA